MWRSGCLGAQQGENHFLLEVNTPFIFYLDYIIQVSSGSTKWWQRIDGKLDWISSRADGEVWGISKTNIFKRRGISSGNPTGTGWTKVQTNLSQVDAYKGQIWALIPYRKSMCNIYNKLQYGINETDFCQLHFLKSNMK